MVLGTNAWGADPPPKPAPSAPGHDEARADAEKRLDEGLQRYSKGDFEGARLAFAQAYAVLSSIDLLYNLTRSEVKSGHPLEALVHIHQMLRDPNATSEDKAKAERLLEEANAVTGHIAVEAPAGAEIVLDDVPSGEAPTKDVFDVTPGMHKVEARSNGNRRRTDVNAPAGDVVTARFEPDVGRAPTVSAPVPLPAPPPPPPEAQKPPPSLSTPASAAPDHAAHHAHASQARLLVPIAIGAVAVVAIGVGVGMGFVSQGKQSDAESFRASNTTGFCADRTSSACTQYQSILDSQQQATDISRGFLVAGGVLALVGVVTYLAWPHARPEQRGWIVVPSAGGARLGVTF
jgi:hypothetical protein